MSDLTPESQDTPLEASQNDVIDQSRRKLAGAALGAGAIFTLASRPVLAGVCNSPSAAASGNLSTHGTPPNCAGKSPGYWKNHNNWPSPYQQGSCTNSCNLAQSWTGGTLFHSVFMPPTNGSNSFVADLDNNASTAKTSLSMQQLLKMNDGNNPWGLTDKDNLGAHIVAALLNARAGLTPVLTENAVIGMWTEWATRGKFSPKAGVDWTSAQIVTYIKSTFS